MILGWKFSPGVGDGVRAGTSPMAGALAYLLRKSSETGGGDIADPESAQYAGRWAGDRVVIVGDYDESRLYQTSDETFTDISRPLAEEYNEFIQVDELKLRVKNEGGDAGAG